MKNGQQEDSGFLAQASTNGTIKKYANNNVSFDASQKQKKVLNQKSNHITSTEDFHGLDAGSPSNRSKAQSKKKKSSEKQKKDKKKCAIF